MATPQEIDARIKALYAAKDARIETLKAAKQTRSDIATKNTRVQGAEDFLAATGRGAPPQKSVGDKIQDKIVDIVPDSAKENINNVVGGFRQAETLTDKISDFAISRVPALGGELQLADSDGMNFKFLTADEVYGKSFATSDLGTRLGMIKNKRTGDLANSFGSYNPDSKSAIIGQLVGSVADPASLAVPMGEGMAAAGRVGAGIGLAYDYFDQKNNVKTKDDLDVVELAKSAGAGYVFGVGGERLTKAVSALWRYGKTSLYGEKLTAEQLSALYTQQKEYGITKDINELRMMDQDKPNFERLATDLNSKYPPLDPKAKTQLALDQNKQGITNIPASSMMMDIHVAESEFPRMTTPDVITVSKGEIYPSRGKRPEPEQPRTMTPEEKINEVDRLQKQGKEALENISKTDNPDRIARLRNVIKQVREQLRKVKAPNPPPVTNTPLDRTKSKKVTGAKREDLLSTQLESPGYGYLNDAKERNILEALKDNRNRRGSDISGLSRLGSVEDRSFSESFRGPKRPIPEKDYPYPRTTQNLESSLGLDRPVDTSRKLIQDFDKATPALDTQLREEYGPRVQQAKERLQAIKERRKANTSLEEQNGSQSVTERSKGILDDPIAEKATSIAEQRQFDYDVESLVDSGAYEMITPSSDFSVTSLYGDPIKDAAYRAGKAIVEKQVPSGSPAGEIISPVVGKLGFPALNSVVRKVAAGFASYNTAFAKLRATGGRMGELAVNLMEEAQQEVQMGKANHLTEVVKKFHELDIPTTGKDADLVMAILRGIKNLPGMPETKHMLAARFIKDNVFNKIAKEAHTSGKWTKEQYEKAISDPYYFPRSFDFELLNTTAGKKSFIETMSTIPNLSKEKAENLINNIIKNDDYSHRVALQGIEAKQDGTYKIPPFVVQLLLDHLGREGSGSRSTHLDFSRKLPEELTDVLSPFMKKGLFHNLNSYLNDTLPAIAFTKRFGVDDVIADEMHAHILKNQGKDAAHHFIETYRDAVRDPRSINLRSFFNATEFERNTIRWFKNVGTLKLSAFGVVNIPQGITNANILLAKGRGISSVDKLSTSYKALTEAFKSKYGNEELQEFYLRSGAANEGALADLIGESHAAAGHVFGREFTGLATPLDYVNNPSKFLQLFGGKHSEGINRRIAVFYGKAYAESLQATKAKLEILRTPDAKQQMRIKENNKALADLGIDPTKKAADINVDDMLRAGNMFNREANFTTDSGHVPRLYNNIYGGSVLLLKSFLFKQSQFVIDHVAKPLIKGDVKPLMAFLAASGVVGQPADAFLRWVRHDDAEYTATQKYLRGMAAIGGFGTYAAVSTMVASDKRSAAAELAGIPISTTFDVLTGAYKSYDKNDPKYFGKAMARTFIPYSKLGAPSLTSDKKEAQNPLQMYDVAPRGKKDPFSF